MRIKPFDGRVSVEAEASVNPTESWEKVMQAVCNIILGAETEYAGGYIKASANDVASLYKIYEQIRVRQTAGVAKRLLQENSSGDSTWVYLNKQAAYIGVVAFCEEPDESPLGPILVKIYSDRLDELINWLTR